MTEQIDFFESGEKPKELSDRIVVISEAIQALAISLRENKWEDPVLKQSAIASFDSLVTSLTELITAGGFRDEQLIVNVVAKLDEVAKEMITGVVLKGTTKVPVTIEDNEDGSVIVTPQNQPHYKTIAEALLSRTEDVLKD